MAIPLVSIGMPAYQAAAHLAGSLESLLAQEHRDFELILVDNASSDGTEAIGEAFAARDPRVRYVRNRQNLGGRRSYNLAQELSRAPYFLWTRSRDHWQPTFLRRCLTILEADADVVLCHARGQVIDGNDVLLGDVGETIDTRGQDLVARLRTVWTSAVGPAAHGVIRTSAMDQTERYREMAGCDVLFLFELATLGAFAFLDEPLLAFRQLRAELSEQETLLRTRELINPFAARRRQPFERHFLDFSRAHLDVIASLPIAADLRQQASFEFVRCWSIKFRGSFERMATALREHVMTEFASGPFGYDGNARLDDIALGLQFLPGNPDLLAAAEQLDLLQQLQFASAATPQLAGAL